MRRGMQGRKTRRRMEEIGGREWSKPARGAGRSYGGFEGRIRN